MNPEYLICEEKESQEEEKEHAGGAIIKQIVGKKLPLVKKNKVYKLKSLTEFQAGLMFYCVGNINHIR